jgi:hypothetical protein
MDRDATNNPVRNRNDYTVPRCRLSLYQSSFIPSVIILWNSVDNDTRITRTADSFKINQKSKVVLAKIPALFLLGYRLFRSNVITDLRCVCGFTREDASHFLLNCRLYIEQMTALFHFLHRQEFQRDIIFLLFGDSNKKPSQNISLSKAVQTFIKTSRRITEETYPPFYLSVFV